MFLRTKYYLIATLDKPIQGSKLPSIAQVLGRYLYLINLCKSKRAAAQLIQDEIIVFWNKARIPTQRKDYIIDKIINLTKLYFKLKDHKNSTSEKHKKKERDFVDTFNDLFDIAPKNALTKITIEEDREFLLNQRKKGRVGCHL